MCCDLIESARTHKAAVACAVPKKHPEVHLEEENPQVNSSDSETACIRESAEEKDGDVSESEQKPRKTHKSLVRLEMHEIYKAPIIPEAKIFQAVVSCVGHDGTIYMIPKLFGKIACKKIHLSMNLITLVHQNVPDRCSSRHVLNQNVVTQGSCLGVLLLGWGPHGMRTSAWE